MNNLYDYFSDGIDIFNQNNLLPQNIVIVDDFFGSGDTFIKFMKSLISKNSSIKSKSIFFVVQQGTFIGAKNIEEFAIESNLTINIVALKLTKKAFEQNNVYNRLFQKYEIVLPSLIIRNMTSRWGSCQIKRNTITLNSRLIETPRECIEYVIVHEFTHFLYPNHSRKFYDLLAVFMPDWKERKNTMEGFIFQRI